MKANKQILANGFSLIELIFSLGLISLLLSSVMSVWLSTQQAQSQLTQLRMAQQLLTNFNEENLLFQKSDLQMINSWQQEAEKFLPGSTVLAGKQHLQINWPSNKPTNIRCHSIKSNESCLLF